MRRFHAITVKPYIIGYIVSAFKQRTSGSAHGLSVIVQSSTTLPSALEERCEAWMITFRKDLEEMSADSIAMEVRESLSPNF